MIIVKVIGGLGNQMFQYAYARSLQESGVEVKLDVSAFDNYSLHTGFELDKYQITLPIATKTDVAKFSKNNYLEKITKKLCLNRRFVKEHSLLFNKKLVAPKDSKYIEGYFQNEKYFSHIREDLIREFKIKDDLSSYAQDIKSNISSVKKSVSLHVRRGDFINNKKTNKIHGSCNLGYYDKALSKLSEENDNFQCFVFSDDIEWVRNNIKGDDFLYVNQGKRSPQEDIYLMSLCSSNIIANSSYSWWGAWLNQNSGLTFAPSCWFLDKRLNKKARDIVPKQWLKI